MNQNIIWLLFLTILAYAEEYPYVDIELDENFQVDEIPISDGWRSISDFYVARDAIWLMEYRRTYELGNSSQITRIELVTKGKNVFIGRREEKQNKDFSNITCFQGQGDDIYFLDLKPGTGPRLVRLSKNGPLKIQRHIRNSTLTRCLSFVNGSVLVEGHRMAPEITSDGKRLQKTAIYDSWSRNSGFSYFIVNSAFSEVTPVFMKSAPLRVLDENGKAKESAIQRISDAKMGMYGRVVALFPRNKPGIRLVDDTGSEIALLFHPGKGMTVGADPNGVPKRRAVQRDVVVNERENHVVIADLVNRTLWFMDFDNQILGRASMPFPVIKMHLDEDGLYLLGNRKEFGRFHYSF